MSNDAIYAIEQALERLLEARENLQAHADSKTHLLLDMLLLDLAQQLARLRGDSQH